MIIGVTRDVAFCGSTWVGPNAWILICLKGIFIYGFHEKNQGYWVLEAIIFKNPKIGGEILVNLGWISIQWWDQLSNDRIHRGMCVCVCTIQFIGDVYVIIWLIELRFLKIYNSFESHYHIFMIIILIKQSILESENHHFLLWTLSTCQRLASIGLSSSSQSKQWPLKFPFGIFYL